VGIILIDGPILEVVRIDAVNDWYRHCAIVDGNWCQQRHKPVEIHLTVGVEKDHNIP